MTMGSMSFRHNRAFALATKYKAWEVLLGIFFVNLVVLFLFALVGRLVGSFLPEFWLWVISGIAFVAFLASQEAEANALVEAARAAAEDLVAAQRETAAELLDEEERAVADVLLTAQREAAAILLEARMKVLDMRNVRKNKS
jgi:Ca2+/H+ antiporter, TMEM165/GDT1 family